MMEELNSMEADMLGQMSRMDVADRMLDLCFILDTTGSMGSYIDSATQNIELICTEIVNSGHLVSADCLRIGLIAYRDHPPQDSSYVTKELAFTPHVPDVKAFLKSLYASGGGDGPEAVAAGMQAAYDLDWRPHASKMAVLIADAPPHGIGEYGDGFRGGDPSGVDPLQLAREYAKRGIGLFVVACEPALSGYSHSTDFFRAIATITSAVMMPLTTANLLPHVIVGSAFEQMDMERLIQEVGEAVAQRVHGMNENVEDIAVELLQHLSLRKEETKHLVVEDIYRDSEEARQNVSVWMAADSCAAAQPNLKRVAGSRFTDQYLASRYSRHSYAYSNPIPLPSRPSPFRPSVSPTVSPPGSPSKRSIVNDFAPFTGSPTFGSRTSFASSTTPPSVSPLSVGAAPSTPPGSPDPDRNGVGGDGGQQKVDLRSGSISLDQARRIATSAAWRTMRA